jgi:hypothetical protein
MLPPPHLAVVELRSFGTSYSPETHPCNAMPPQSSIPDFPSIIPLAETL